MPDYALIIPAYNEEKWLGATLETAREAMRSIEPSGELIVVDNNSSDRTAEVARGAGADQVVFEPHNQIAKARNAGAKVSTSERLVFLDADTLLESETLRIALDRLASGEVVAGGARIVMDQPVSPIVRWLLDNWNAVATRFAYAGGSFFYCRRDAFEAVGGFDESVYAGEEVWLAKRAKRWGRKRGMRFELIEDPPVRTSGRKSDWFSTWDFVRQLALIFLLPGATRSRRLCRLWYHRPRDSEQDEIERPNPVESST